MRLFKCQICQQILYFENTLCERCSHRLGYLPAAVTLSALEEIDGKLWRALASPRETYRYAPMKDGEPATGWSMLTPPTRCA
jgi:hypothetical protein